MVWIPSGSISVGQPPQTSKVESSGDGYFQQQQQAIPFLPRNTYETQGFFWDAYEVSNREYQQFIRQFPEWSIEEARGVPNKADANYLLHWEHPSFSHLSGPNQPVVFVSWYAAQAYCQDQGKQLPTESEWEYVAHGKFPKKVLGSTWFYANAQFSSQPVGALPANEWGVHDGYGNVWEWTQSSFSWKPQSKALGKVIRGGSWLDGPDMFEPHIRDYARPLYSVRDIGFRCMSEKQMEVVSSFNIQSWAYQLQGYPQYPIAKMQESPVDLIVMDYSHDGSATRRLTLKEVQQIRQGVSDESKKVVLSYLSIGEAEEFRFYWKPEWKQSPPPFLAKPNPVFPDNHKVHYWSALWQPLIIDYLDQIVDAGFDGVYLDIIDAYYYFSPEGPEPLFESEQEPADLMIQFVLSLAKHARETRGRRGFMVFPQNAAEIVKVASPKWRKQYMEAIDGIGVESTFYWGAQENDNPYAPQEYVLEALKEFQQANKTILAIDYLTKSSDIQRFYELAQEAGFIPYVNERALKTFAFPKGHEP